MIYSVFLWRNGFRRDDHVNYLLLLLGFGFHTTAMLLRGFRLDHCPVTNLYEATIFAMWTIVAVYLVVGLWARLRFLGAFASPVLFAIGVFALMPSLDALHEHQARTPSRLDERACRADVAFLRRVWAQRGGGADVSDPGAQPEVSQAAGHLLAHAAHPAPGSGGRPAAASAGFVLLTLGLAFGRG